jgi:hypothetical protein
VFASLVAYLACIQPHQNQLPSGGVAQLVEQRTHKPRVGSSILPTATKSFRDLSLGCSKPTSSGCGPVADFASPMVCDRKFHADFPQFTWPEWTDMDPWEHRDLIRQIDQYRVRDNPRLAQAFESELEKWSALLKVRIGRGDIALSRATLKWHDEVFDILRYTSESECDPTQRWTWRHPGGRRYVVIKGKTTLDFSKMKFFDSVGVTAGLTFSSSTEYCTWPGG